MKLLYLILVSTFLFSCSAKWHYNKAIKKGMEITNKSDTIRITTIDSIPIIQHDTITPQNQGEIHKACGIGCHVVEVVFHAKKNT